LSQAVAADAKPRPLLEKVKVKAAGR
jgi:hypothetical protein